MKNHNKEFNLNIEKFTPLEGKTLCVALSGGADSVCLLYKLLDLTPKYQFNVIAAHINHHLRGDESDRDANFCRELCNKLSVDLQIFDIDVISLSKAGESVEEAARRLRYNALFSVDCDFIVTAHHLDDNAETVLINMLRGTGLKGLCGIPEKRDKIIRPMLSYSKEDVLRECNKNGWDFVTDSTNDSNDYTRNLLRHKVIPVFRKINPSFSKVFDRNIRLLKSDNDFICLVAEDVFKTAEKNNKLDIRFLKDKHPAVLSRVLQIYCKKNSNIVPDAFHTEEFIRIINAEKGSFELSKGFYAKVKKDYFYLEKEEKVDFFVRYNVIESENIDKYLKINNLLLKNAIDYDKICGKFSVTTRKDGDKIRLVGRGVTKSLRRIQQEMGIPEYLRTKIPVAADDDGVFWIYKIGIAERVAADSNTKKLLIFSVYQN